MACLLSGFTKKCFPSSNAIRTPEGKQKGPDTENLKKAYTKPKPLEKPVFCIYDSDDSESAADKSKRRVNPHFIISGDVNLYPHPKLNKTLAPTHPASVLNNLSTPFSPWTSSTPKNKRYRKSNLFSTRLSTSSQSTSSLPSISWTSWMSSNARISTVSHMGTSPPSFPGSVMSSSSEKAYPNNSCTPDSSEDCFSENYENSFSNQMNITTIFNPEEPSNIHDSSVENVPYVRQSYYPNLRRTPQLSVCNAEGGRGMGAGESKTTFRQAVNQLDRNAELWDQLECENISSIQDVFAFLPGNEIRRIREENPKNLATLCYKLVEKLILAVESSCRTQSDQQTVLNSCRILTRLIPHIFEDAEWRSFFWSRPDPSSQSDIRDGSGEPPLAESLIMAVSDLLFCPEFTVGGGGNKARDEVDDLENLDSCEHIWERGVGFAQSPPQIPQHHYNRCELLRLLLTCFSQTMYLLPQGEAHIAGDRWVKLFTSPRNRHALPLFTSLLNSVCSYVPGGILPYNHLIWSDSKENLVEMALQVLVVCLDQDPPGQRREDSSPSDNLFINYLSRIHRDEDFQMILHGITRLLMNPLHQTYLPFSQRKVCFHQELLILFWKLCEHNKKFLFFVLKSSDVLDILVPILHYLNDARADQSRAGLMHIGVFILLLLSGERNFGVRLNKPFTASVPMDIPVFSGSHADLLIIVFHKIITSGHARLQPLFDCLLTVLCNVSPYIKTMSMVASCKLIHLVEAFSTPWFLMSTPSNHHLVYFLLEMLNNLVQYQFDGNSNLVYTIIRKRNVFHNLANLPVDGGNIAKTLNKKARGRKSPVRRKCSQNDESMEGSIPALPAEPGTLKASLISFPGVESLTEHASAHPSQKQLQRLTQTLNTVKLDPVDPIMFPVQPGESQSRRTSESADPRDHSDKDILFNHEQGLETSQGSTDETRDESSTIESDAGSKVTSPVLSRQSSVEQKPNRRQNRRVSLSPEDWVPTTEWVKGWKDKLPLHTIMRLLQVLVPQVEKMCMDKGLTDESEILRFLQHGTLVGLLPVPHPILIRRYQANPGTAMWFRTYMWGVIYLRNIDPAVWYETDIKLFQVQRI